MNNMNRPLGHHLTEAKNRPAAFSEERLRQMLDEHAATGRSFEPLQPQRIGGYRMGLILSGLLAVSLSSTLLLTGVFGGDDHAPTNRASYPLAVASFDTSGLSVNASLEFMVVVEGRRPIDDATAAAGHKPYTIPVSITGVQGIELTREELAKIGVRSLDRGIVEYYQLQQNNHWYAMSLTMESAGGEYAPLGEGPDPLPRRFFPCLVTDDVGRRRVYSYVPSQVNPELAGIMEELGRGFWRRRGTDEWNDKSKESQYWGHVYTIMDQARDRYSMVSKLVPILVRTGRIYTPEDSLAGRWRPDCILWYEPTPEFLSALPDRVRHDPESDLSALRQIESEREKSLKPDDHGTVSIGRATPPPEKGEIRRPAGTVQRSNPTGGPVEASRRVTPDRSARAPQIGVPDAVAGTSRFEALRSYDGAIVSALLLADPASASDVAHLECMLDAPRTVTISLHALDGQQLRNFLEAENHQAGLLRIDLPLDRLSSGMYLLVITTEQGERTTLRLLVNHAR